MKYSLKQSDLKQYLANAFKNNESFDRVVYGDNKWEIDIMSSIDRVHIGIKVRYNENSWGRFGVSKNRYRKDYVFVNYSDTKVEFPEHIKKRIKSIYNTYISVQKQFVK